MARRQGPRTAPKGTNGARLARQADLALAALLAGLERTWRRGARPAIEGRLLHEALATVVLRVVFVRLASARGLLPQGEGLEALRRALRARAPLDLAGHEGFARLRDMCIDVHKITGGASPLFDPLRFPFLDGAGAPCPDDEATLSLLDLTATVDGEVVDHGALDLEVLGAVHERLLCITLHIVAERSFAAGPRGAVVGLEALLATPPQARAEAFSRATAARLSPAEARAVTDASGEGALFDALARHRSRLTPRPVDAGGFCPAASDARRRAGAHYTPPSIADAVVSAALAPLLARHDVDARTLTVCDPAMGAGAFLLSAARLLAGHLAPPGSDAKGALDARRTIALRCLHGVDRDHLAVTLCKLTLWLFVGDPSLPLSFADHALCHGDALVGFDAAQLAAFDWAAPADPPRLGALRATLERAAALREAARHDPGDEALSGLAEALVSPERAAADALLSCFFSATSEASRARLRDALAKAQRPPKAPRAAPPLAFHWPLELPEIFARERPGFDLVIGNPPFLNAIEARTGRTAPQAALAAALFGPFARGACDACVLFWGRVTGTLLREGGRYGLLSPLALLSSRQPWHRVLHERFRPDAVFVYPAAQVEGASIRTCALVGGVGAPDRCQVQVTLDDGRVERHEARWSEAPASWYEALGIEAVASGLPRARPGSAGDGPSLEPLSHRFVVRAGCTTGVAYELAELVHDDAQSSSCAPALITTGAIDRFTCRWGATKQRFLGRDLLAPRWPPGPPFEGALARARDAQRRPKIIVGGLSAVIEAWLDATGDAAGVVSTWVITERRPGERGLAPLEALTVLLNSATFSHELVARQGGATLSGRQLTIKKAALLEAMVPDVFGARWLVSMPPSLVVGPPREAVAALSALHAALTAGPEPPYDTLAHLLVAKLYGYSDDGALTHLRWWRARTRAPGAADLADAVEMLKAINVTRGV